MRNDEQKRNDAERARKYRETHKDRRTYAERVRTPEDLSKRNEQQKRYGKTPEFRAKHAAYMRQYWATHPEARAKRNEERKIYAQTPNGLASTKRHIEKLKAAGPNHVHRWKWKLTDEQLRELLVTQGGVCALCGNPGDLVLDKPYSKANMNALVIDHCHVTGQRRGLIHQRCNSILGYANDKVELLEGAIRYLQAFRTAAM